MAETPTDESAGQGSAAARLIKQELRSCHIELAVTLPDTWFVNLFNEFDREPKLQTVPVSSEVEGVGICSGAFFGGVGSCLVMANAGFMLSMYGLPTLSMMHRIPLFMLMSLRGKIGDLAFYQEYQGLLTEPLLDLLGISYTYIDSLDDIPRISEAYRHARLFRKPAAALLMKSVLV